jgi:hypothetical protein
VDGRKGPKCRVIQKSASRESAGRKVLLRGKNMRRSLTVQPEEAALFIEGRGLDSGSLSWRILL